MSIHPQKKKWGDEKHTLYVSLYQDDFIYGAGPDQKVLVKDACCAMAGVRILGTGDDLPGPQEVHTTEWGVVINI